jgi:hypothetical protein
MNDQRPAYHHPFFSELPRHLKVLYSMILLMLGIGYLFAMIQIFEVHAGVDGKPGLSVRDIQIAYAGTPENSRLETALRGPMAGMASPEQIRRIISWARAGANEQEFSSDIRPILQERCVACHSGANPNLPKLVGYDDVRPLTESDHGVSIGALVRVSHVHLFGMTFIFAFLGLIFSHAYVRQRYLKSILIALPFLAIFVDIGSWWLTKVSIVFAYTVFAGGTAMGVSFALQWLISIYQLWFLRTPPEGARPD